MSSTTELSSKQNRFEWLDLAHVIAGIGITYLTSNAVFMDFANKEYWISSNIIDSLFRFCIPVFFMMPCITSLAKIDLSNLKQFYKEKAWMSLFPYIVWSLIGFAFNYFYMKSVKGDVSLLSILSGLADGSLYSIFWFFIPMFGIYLSMPLFAAISKDRQKQIMIFLLCAGVICDMFIPFVLDVFNIHLDWAVQVLSIAGYLIYLPAGWVIANTDFSKKQSALIYVIGLAGLLWMIFGTWQLSMKSNAADLTYKEYTSFSCFVWSFAVMLGIKQAAPHVFKAGWLKKLCAFLVQYTFCFYLMHKFIFDFCTKSFGWNPQTLLYRLGMPLLAFPIIIAVTWLLRKIPGIRRIVP